MRVTQEVNRFSFNFGYTTLQSNWLLLVIGCSVLNSAGWCKIHFTVLNIWNYAFSSFCINKEILPAVELCVVLSACRTHPWLPSCLIVNIWGYSCLGHSIEYGKKISLFPYNTTMIQNCRAWHQIYIYCEQFINYLEYTEKKTTLYVI